MEMFDNGSERTEARTAAPTDLVRPSARRNVPALAPAAFAGAPTR
jgi:hypothetical protein